MRPLRRLSALLACAAVTTLACAAGASAATFTGPARSAIEGRVSG